MNKIILLGRLTKDPEVRLTPAEKTVCTFTLAVDRPFTDKNGKRIYIAKPIVDNPLLERLDSATIIAWFRCNSCLTCRFREKVIDVDKKKDIHWCSRTHQSANFIDMVEFLGYSKE